jgi:putative FmdB family regulatory protein
LNFVARIPILPPRNFRDPTVPIYEYTCEACGERQEIIQKISDQPLEKCPLCGARKLRKLVSAAAFRLKGGGWYETDFKDEKKQKNVIKKEEAAAEKTEAKSEAKPDKAEKKTETSKAEAKEKKKAKKAAED